MQGLSTAPVARVWLSRDRRIGGGEPTLCAYVIHAPLSHPFWAWHVMVVMHLRPTAKHGEANLRFPGASHEVFLTALDPTHDDQIDVDDAETWKHMSPPDYVGQVMLADDDQALRLGELMAKSITDGHLVPDSDHTTWWDRVLAVTTEHLRIGGHDGEAV